MMALNWDNIIITTDEYSYSIDAEQRMIIFSGAPGSAGPAGPQGPAATIAVGTTTTLPAGSNATVENVGTSTAAVFNFGIPRGSSGGGGGGDAMWGEISGTLSDQTDLQNALDGKAAANHNHDDRYLTEAETVQAINYKISLVTDELGTMAAVNDAPSDSKTYGRKNGAWTEVSGGGGGSTAWGDITGTLADQTDLNTALGAKANTADLGDLAVKDTVDWDTDIDDIPQTFPPSAHTHDDRYYTESEVNTALAAKANTADLGDLATQDTVDYATEVTYKPTLGALAAKNTADYATDVTNKPTLGSIAAANYTISSTDLTDGTSPLTTGDLYFYYEA